MVFRGEKNKTLLDVDLVMGDRGDQWDHVALAVESRLIVSMVPGKRTSEQTNVLLADFGARTANVPILFTSDEYGPYADAIARQYPNLAPARIGENKSEVHPGLVYATVHKVRKKGRVVSVTKQLVRGTEAELAAALDKSCASHTVNTSFVERYNATDRNHNKRKARKTYCFSKELDVHIAATWIGVTVYNFCRPHRGLACKDLKGKAAQRTPAMVAGIEKSIRSYVEIAHTPLRIRSISTGVP